MNQANKKRILIIAPYQFGELSDYYYWAKYATLEGWEVTYIGYKYKNRLIKNREYPGVKDKSVKHYRNRLVLGILFYLRCVFEIIWFRHKSVFVCQMPFCHLLPKLFPHRKIILDLRTLSVAYDETIRRQQDDYLINLARLFPICSVISDGVGRRLNRPYNVIPLGAEELSFNPKQFDELRLFYIGTFNNRNLSIFIRGLALYQKESNDNVTLDIVGGGNKEEEELIRSTISTSGVKGVSMRGYLTHDEAIPFFDKCNIGVCFVPVTDYYQNQPPTKLFEYLLSGMAVIATNTDSNLAVMNPIFGVVINDTVESVCDGLKQISSRLAKYDAKQIVANAMKYHWGDIVRNNVLTITE